MDVTLDCADESTALAVLHHHAEVGPSEHGRVAVHVGHGELDGRPRRPPDNGVEGEERADGHVRRLGCRRGAAEAKDEQTHRSSPALPPTPHHLHSPLLRGGGPVTVSAANIAPGKKKLESSGKGEDEEEKAGERRGASTPRTSKRD